MMKFFLTKNVSIFLFSAYKENVVTQTCPELSKLVWVVCPLIIITISATPTSTSSLFTKLLYIVRKLFLFLILLDLSCTAGSIISFIKVDSDVISLDEKEPMQKEADVGVDGKLLQAATSLPHLTSLSFWAMNGGPLADQSTWNPVVNLDGLDL